MKLLIKVLALAVTLLGIVCPISSYAKERRAQHYIFFVHGLGGNDHSFGHMPEAIVKDMDRLDKAEKHHSFIFSYPTKDDNLDAEDFALYFGEFIHQNLKDKIKSDDKISIISHSQGGLVSLMWYFRASLGQKEFYPQYTKHMDGFVTLGTPFWGSKIASITQRETWRTYVDDKIKEYVLSSLGDKQLQEMSLGSRINLNFRTNVTRNIPATKLHEMKSEIRPLNIAGMAELSKILKGKASGWKAYVVNNLPLLTPYLFGGDHFESDTAVSIPSARFDSIYTLDNRANYQENSILDTAKPYQTDFGPLLIVRTLHASHKAEEIYDMAYLPKKCLDIQKCDHPTYSYVLQHLLGQKVPEFSPQVPKDALAGFTLAFKVNLAEYRNASQTDVKIDLINYEQSRDYNLVLEPEEELVSRHDYYNPKQKNIFYRHSTGFIEYESNSGKGFEKARWDGIRVWFKISAPGHKTKIVQTIIKPTYSSYVEVTLAEKLPQVVGRN